MTYTKNSVETYVLNGTEYPSVNVKAYSYPSVFDIVEHFDCSEDAAEEALQTIFEYTQVDFWETIDADFASSILKTTVNIYSAGRSGGHLIVENYYPFESWDAVDLARWRTFEKAVKAEVAYVTSLAYVLEAIDANEWLSE